MGSPGVAEAMAKLLVATAGVDVDSRDEGGRKSIVGVAHVLPALLPRLDDATDICRRLA